MSTFDDSSFADIMCLIPTETIALAMDHLFRYVHYTRPNVQDLVVLHGDIDGAFEGLEPIAIYEALVRCLCVNFTGSFSVLLSRMGGEASPSTPPSNTQTSLPLSAT